jgi:hypothetical protein
LGDDAGTDNYLKEGFTLDIEWYIFYNDSGRNDIVVQKLVRRSWTNRGIGGTERRRTAGGRQVRIVVGR